MKRSSLTGPVIYLALFMLMVLAACSSPGDPSPTPADPLVTEGIKVFKRNCIICHSLKPDRVITGPSLYGIASRAGERMAGFEASEYLTLSITKPGEYLVQGFSDLMPADFGDKLDREEIDAVIAYLMTLE